MVWASHHLFGLYIECVFQQNLQPPTPYSDWETVFYDLEDPTNIGYNYKFVRLIGFLASK